MLRRRGIVMAVTVVALAAGLTACGRDDFKNDPRPPVPAEVSIKMGNGGISVSPKEFGAGLVNFTVANLTTDPLTLEIKGPVDATTDEIPPAGTQTIKLEVKMGGYEASDREGTLRPFQFTVGPERPSGQNDLLLP